MLRTAASMASTYSYDKELIQQHKEKENSETIEDEKGKGSREKGIQKSRLVPTVLTCSIDSLCMAQLRTADLLYVHPFLHGFKA